MLHSRRRLTVYSLQATNQLELYALGPSRERGDMMGLGNLRFFLAIIVVCFLLQNVSASLGDWLPEFRECVEVSQNSRRNYINTDRDRFARRRTVCPERISYVSH